MTSVEQLIRIGLFTAGGFFLGDGVANSEMYQAAVSGLIQVGTFAWWMYRNSKKG